VNPRATYRLQLGTDLDLAEARALLPYLRDLGISHVYLSPSFEARPGSPHGYDVIDPNRLAGDEEDLRALAEGGLRVILDIVPNHMAATDENRYWRDPALRERFFDIDPITGRHRRFFDIDHLAGVRQEDPEVFAETHRLALRLVRDGLVYGLRIDHPDGLADPAGYLRRLRAEGVEHVWVEKILSPGERLRDWPVEGTVGYEFLNDATALFVDPAGEGTLTELYGGGAYDPVRPKLEQLRGTLAREAERLRRLYDSPELELALASLPVYRTYIPAVMAKGVEDTAFYRYNRLLALNEVGGDPSRFGLAVEEFHRLTGERHRHGLLTTQTHDTKRSGDVRARIGALAGMADEWAEQVGRWRQLEPPDWNEAYLIFQTLVGAWPLELERLEAYVQKALREAKVNTNWVTPDLGYERRVRDWCLGLYSNRAFLDELEAFADRVARVGERSALGQTLLKLTAPGVPDIYQGDELWALSLVDPDNRRPVDWDRRREALRELRAGAAPERETIKLFLIERGLALRARRPEVFAGSYTPLEAGGDCCAYLRGGEVLAATAIRPSGGSARLEFPAGRWRNVLTGDELDVRAPVPFERLAMHDWGLALLERVAG
jgi:(1->4)-alpha-D-glucan 1-alpha-D-glucosylmutase